MSSGWLYDDCTPLDHSVSEHSPFGIPLLCSVVCLCACLCPVTLRAHLPVIVYTLLVVVLSCKRNPAGLCIIAEVLRSVTRRVTRRRSAGGLQGSGVFGTTPRHLHSKKWQEAWEARRQQQALRAAQDKKKKAENWEKAKRDYDSVGGTPFNGVRAIAREHNVAIARLRCYVDRCTKRHHGYDTDSLALVSDSGSDDFGDGDSDATM